MQLIITILYNLKLKELKLKFNSNLVKLEKLFQNLWLENLLYKIILLQDFTLLKVMFILLNHMFNLFNKEKMQKYNGNNQMIKYMKEILLLENLFIKLDKDLKMSLYLVILIIVKKSLNHKLIEKNLKLDLHKSLLSKEN